MAKKFDNTYADDVKIKLKHYQKKGFSIRQIAKVTGASRSYIHRLSMQIAASSGSMQQATQRRKDAGWEPLPPGNSISWEAIQIKKY